MHPVELVDPLIFTLLNPKTSPRDVIMMVSAGFTAAVISKQKPSWLQRPFQLVCPSGHCDNVPRIAGLRDLFGPALRVVFSGSHRLDVLPVYLPLFVVLTVCGHKNGDDRARWAERPGRLLFEQVLQTCFTNHFVTHLSSWGRRPI